MDRALAPRKRSPFGADLWIIVLGVWGFVLQTLKCWVLGDGESDGER